MPATPAGSWSRATRARTPPPAPCWPATSCSGSCAPSWRRRRPPVPDIGQRVLGGDDKLKALIVTGHTDIHHDWRTISPMLRDLLKATRLFRVRLTEAFRRAG